MNSRLNEIALGSGENRRQDASKKAGARTSYVATLDGWRAIAISGVMIHHAFNPGVYGHVFDLGMLGVMLFFAISGFIITNRITLEYDQSGTLSLKNFYIRRICRIIPPALVFLLVIYLLGLFQIVPCGTKEVLSCILFLRNYITNNVGWYTSHFWSLSVEEHFYLVWPGIFLLAGRKQALRIATFMAVIAILWRVVDGHFNFVVRLLHNPDLANSPFRSDYCADGLFWGCALALWLPWSRFKWRPSGRITTFLCFLITAVVLGTRYFAIPHNYVVTGLGMAALIGCTIWNPHSLIGRVLEIAPLRFVGKISYSLYLWQMLFLPWSPKYSWQRLPFNIALAFICAVLSYHVIEEPLIRLGRRLTQKQNQHAVVR